MSILVSKKWKIVFEELGFRFVEQQDMLIWFYFKAVFQLPTTGALPGLILEAGKD